MRVRERGERKIMYLQVSTKFSDVEGVRWEHRPKLKVFDSKMGKNMLRITVVLKLDTNQSKNTRRIC